MVSRDSKVDYFASSLLFLFFLLLIIIKSGLLARIRWSVCMLKSNRSLCVAFSRTGAGLCIYHLLVWSNLNFLHISQWITLPTQSCLALYSLCANLLHSLIIWLMYNHHQLLETIHLRANKWLLLNRNDYLKQCFANGLRVGSSILGRVITKTQKMVLDASFLNTRHYKLQIKSKV